MIFMIGCTDLWASDRKIKGYVLDKEGTPLTGAYVYDENKKNTAITDENGYFEISVPEEARMLKAGYVDGTARRRADSGDEPEYGTEGGCSDGRGA